MKIPKHEIWKISQFHINHSFVYVPQAFCCILNYRIYHKYDVLLFIIYSSVFNENALKEWVFYLFLISQYLARYLAWRQRLQAAK